LFTQCCGCFLSSHVNPLSLLSFSLLLSHLCFSIGWFLHFLALVDLLFRKDLQNLSARFR
jgi:hypothetical protein